MNDARAIIICTLFVCSCMCDINKLGAQALLYFVMAVVYWYRSEPTKPPKPPQGPGFTQDNFGSKPND